MRERIKETVPEIRRRAEKDKRFLDWEPEQEEARVSGVRPETKRSETAVPPAGNRGLRFDEWAEENQRSRKSVSAAPLPKRAAVPSLAAGPAGNEAEDRPVSTHRSGRFGGQEDRPASGSIAGTAGEPGGTGWTGRLRPGWSVDDLLPRETVEAARIPESYRSILQEPDYRDNSRYVPTGNGKKGMTWQEALLGQWLDAGYDDPVYEYINGNTDAINKLFCQREHTVGDGQPVSD